VGSFARGAALRTGSRGLKPVVKADRRSVRRSRFCSLAEGAAGFNLSQRIYGPQKKITGMKDF
jgi:hypothetical protein